MVGAAGTAMSANAASKSRKALSSTTGDWLPNINQYQDQYFQGLNQFEDEAGDLAASIGERDLDNALKLREKMFPGLGGALKESSTGIFDLMKGKLPQSVMDAFTRSGGASSVGQGFGGSGFGFLNQGLFGARGALGAMQTGYGLLGSLLSSSPALQAPSAMTFLQNLATPAQRAQNQLTVRGQNMNVANSVAQMPTSSQTWGNFLTTTGGQLAGAGVTSYLSPSTSAPKTGTGGGINGAGGNTVGGWGTTPTGWA